MRVFYEPCIAPSEMTRFCIPEFMVWGGEEVLLVWNSDSEPRPLLCNVCLYPVWFHLTYLDFGAKLNYKTISKLASLSLSSFSSPIIMNIPDQQTNISRANSRASGRSRNGSSMSRNQSLIKKNISHDLKPADILIERFVAWKAIVQQLTAYFEVIIS